MGPEAPISHEAPFPTRIEPLIPKQIRLPENVRQWIRDWFVEVKWNGIRAVVYIPKDGEVVIRTKGQHDVAENFPTLVAGFRKLGERHSLVLDGELIYGEGKTPHEMRRVVGQAFSKPRRPIRESPGFSYMTFEAVYFDGQDLTDQAIEKRKAMLRKALPWQARKEFGIYVPFSEGTNHINLMEAARRDDYEGIVLKRKGSKYKKPVGRAPSPWLKYKFPPR